MNDVEEGSRQGSRRVLRLVFRVVGVTALVLGGVTAVLYALGSWNPSQSVVLEYRFGNPMVGLLVAPLLLLVGVWLALPVRNETRPRGRLAARWLCGVVTLVGLLGWGLFGDHFSFEAEEIARSDDGGRAVALVRDAATPPNLSVRIWEGSGLATREVAELGRVCGAVSAGFLTEHRFELRTTYGDWAIDLDPDTGEPLAVLGPGCSDGPQPVSG